MKEAGQSDAVENNLRIIKFLKKHHVLTLATSKENEPWCCSCFYAVNPEKMQLLVVSDLETRHISELLLNNKVSGNIVLETKVIGNIQGIQFSGKMEKAIGDEHNEVWKIYMKRFPFAILTKTELWTIRLDFVKLTDNRLGFGQKINWYRQK